MCLDAVDVAVDGSVYGVDTTAHFSSHACADQKREAKNGCDYTGFGAT